MSKMSKHERAIRDRMERLEDFINELAEKHDHYRTRLEEARRVQVILYGLLKDAEEDEATPAAEEDEAEADVRRSSGGSSSSSPFSSEALTIMSEEEET